jgi:hypothetical protein
MLSPVITSNYYYIPSSLSYSCPISGLIDSKVNSISVSINASMHHTCIRCLCNQLRGVLHEVTADSKNDLHHDICPGLLVEWLTRLTYNPKGSVSGFDTKT